VPERAIYLPDDLDTVAQPAGHGKLPMCAGFGVMALAGGAMLWTTLKLPV
jgi:hypothetical protein